jgi:hypothetical protein
VMFANYVLLLTRVFLSLGLVPTSVRGQQSLSFGCDTRSQT